MARRILLIIIILLLLLLFVAVPSVSWAQSREQAAPEMFRAAAKEFVAKVLAATGRARTLKVWFRNLSSLTAVEFGAGRLQVEEALRARGVRLVNDNADAEVRVTFSESAAGFLLVGDVAGAASVSPVFVSFLAKPLPILVGSVDSIVLHKRLLFEQEDPILDVGLSEVLPGNAVRMVVLDTHRLTVYHAEAGRWVKTASGLLPEKSRRSRDLRGRVVMNPYGFSAVFPAGECAFTSAEPAKLECSTPDAELLESWGEDFFKLNSYPGVVEFNARQNAFVYRLTEDSNEKAPRIILEIPFYSVARTGEKQGQQVIFSGTDGRILVFHKKDAKPERIAAHWGSDVVALESECATYWHLLATRAGDWTEPDAVQASRIVQQSVVAISPPLEFAGPVTALWARENNESAVAVIRNLRTGKYEAYQITVGCNRP
jgi:hypothetical protein